jgi:hypothetical protein
VSDGYGIDLEAFSLQSLRDRLAHGDLLPSHRPLRENLDVYMASLAALGIDSVQQLVDLLTTPKAVEKAAARTGIPVAYLTLLRRHVRGYIPSPVPLAEIPACDATLVQALACAGIKETKQLFVRGRTHAGRAALAAELAVDANALTPLLEMADLARVGWIGPLGVRWFHTAGIRSAAALAAADADTLHARLLEVNRVYGYTKVTLGRKDIDATIATARSLPPGIEP